MAEGSGKRWEMVGGRSHSCELGKAWELPEAPCPVAILQQGLSCSTAQHWSGGALYSWLTPRCVRESPFPAQQLKEESGFFCSGFQGCLFAVIYNILFLPRQGLSGR